MCKGVATLQLNVECLVVNTERAALAARYRIVSFNNYIISESILPTICQT
jgi:hypothetical protein